MAGVSCHTSNDTQISACFTRGVCSVDADANWSCHCFDPFNSRYSFCQRSYFADYTSLWIVYLIVTVEYVLMPLLNAVDLGMELQMRRSRLTAIGKEAPLLKTPTFVGKIFFFFFELYAAAYNAMMTYLAYRGESLTVVTFGIWQAVFFLFGALSYPFFTVAWLDTILRAKSLGAADRGVQIYTRILVVSAVVSAALLLTASLISFIGGTAAAVATFVILMVQTVELLLVAIGTMYYLVLSTRWAWSLQNTDTTKKVMRQNFLVFIATLAVFTVGVTHGYFTNANPDTFIVADVIIESLGYALWTAATNLIVLTFAFRTGFMASYVTYFRNPSAVFSNVSTTATPSSMNTASRKSTKEVANIVTPVNSAVSVSDDDLTASKKSQ